MKGWRTLAYNAAIALGGVAITADWGSMLPSEYVGPATIAVGTIGALLRYATTTPVGQK